MRDLVQRSEPLPGVMAFDFAGGRIAAMNDLILAEMRTAEVTPDSIHGDNILNRRATQCLFDRTPLPPGLGALAERLYAALAVYVGRWRPEFVGAPFRHRSWCNHYKPNEGVPWHDHAETPVVAVYSVKGDGGDLIIQDGTDPQRCHRVETPPGRMIFMDGRLRHCSTPNFGPVAARVSLPVNFTFGPAPQPTRP
ncbi:hypothetical protein RJ527_08770 [Thalassospiraceae bacterium LMO-SO8]|nr:hypothetical protein [Alphaproteobacteria bacterium LMO-S08]WND77823.1 hypothetical protein RJ527_08770 [Thalassospiraceae bacterium LMO-SO8]